MVPIARFPSTLRFLGVGFVDNNYIESYSCSEDKGESEGEDGEVVDCAGVEMGILDLCQYTIFRKEMWTFREIPLIQPALQPGEFE